MIIERKSQRPRNKKLYLWIKPWMTEFAKTSIWDSLKQEPSELDNDRGTRTLLVDKMIYCEIPKASIVYFQNDYRANVTTAKDQRTLLFDKMINYWDSKTISFFPKRDSRFLKLVTSETLYSQGTENFTCRQNVILLRYPKRVP